MGNWRVCCRECDDGPGCGSGSSGGEEVLEKCGGVAEDYQ